MSYTVGLVAIVPLCFLFGWICCVSLSFGFPACLDQLCLIKANDDEAGK